MGGPVPCVPAGSKLAIGGTSMRIMETLTENWWIEHEIPHGNDVHVVWHPSGLKLAMGGQYGKLFIVDTYSGAIELDVTLPSSGEVNNIAWHPQGPKIAACSRGSQRLYIVDIVRGAVEHLSDDCWCPFAWHPSGRTLIYGSWVGGIGIRGHGLKIRDAVSGVVEHEEVCGCVQAMCCTSTERSWWSAV